MEGLVPLTVCLGIGIPLLTYILLSILFFCQPHLLHDVKRRQSFKARHVSHGGGGGEKLDATIEAFTNAVEAGTEILEIDVRLTSDDVVVLFHDDTLERSCSVNEAVRDVKFVDLPNLRPKLNLYYKKGHWTEGEDRRIITLKELFETFPETPVIIELKGTEDLLVKKVSDLIQEFGREDLTAWGSESDITSRMFKQNPKIPLFFSNKTGFLLVILFYTGLLPFVHLKESLFMAPMPSVENDPDSGFKHSRGKRFKTWITDKLLMRPSLFRHLSARGIDTYLFVLNKESEFDRAFKRLKVTGVLTDFPTRLSKYLHALDEE